MDFYEINCLGEFKIEKKSTIPTWTGEDTSRLLFVEDENQMYFGGSSAWKVFLGGEYIETPQLDIVGYPEISQTVVFSGSTLNIVWGDEDTHIATNWQLYDENGTVIWESLDDNVNLTSLSLGSEQLTSSSEYYISVQYSTLNHGDSNKVFLNFKTDIILTYEPSLFVEGQPASIQSGPVLISQPFYEIFPSDDTHVSTDWAIYANDGITLIWSSLSNTVNLETIKIPDSTLAQNTTYIFKVRYESALHGLHSVWTTVTYSTGTFFNWRTAVIGDYYAGGYYAGVIHNDYETYALIVSPKSGGEILNIQFDKLNNINYLYSMWDGESSTNLSINVNHPAALWSDKQIINGFLDWYIPSLDEMQLCYKNFKPTTMSNSTGFYYRNDTDEFSGRGLNLNDEPRGIEYTSNSPAKTSVTSFQTGNVNALNTTSDYWTSTVSENDIHQINTFNALDGEIKLEDLNTYNAVRVMRKIPFDLISQLQIGDYYAGGYYAGLIDYNDTKYMIIVAPKEFENAVYDSYYGLLSYSLIVGGSDLGDISIDVSSRHKYVGNIIISPDGTKLIIVAQNAYYTSSYTFYEFNLTVPWNIESYTNGVNYSTGIKNWQGYNISAVNVGSAIDGTKIWFHVNERVYGTYDFNEVHFFNTTNSTLSEATSGNVYDLEAYNFTNFTGEVIGIQFNNDGSKMYLTSNQNDGKMYSYNLSIPWNIASYSYITTQQITSTNLRIRSMEFNETGTVLILSLFNSENNTTFLSEYKLSTPWDIETFELLCSTTSEAVQSTFYSGSFKFYDDTKNFMYKLNGGIINKRSLVLPSIESDLSEVDGQLNTSILNNIGSEENFISWCDSAYINGYDDWYVPAKAEMDVVYRNLKPTTDSNDINIYTNIYTNPDEPNYTLTDPTISTVNIFKSTGTEYFNYSDTVGYWLSDYVDNYTESKGILCKSFKDGSMNDAETKSSIIVRPIRRVYI